MYPGGITFIALLSQNSSELTLSFAQTAAVTHGSVDGYCAVVSLGDGGTCGLHTHVAALALICVDMESGLRLVGLKKCAGCLNYDN